MVPSGSMATDTGCCAVDGCGPGGERAPHLGVGPPVWLGWGGRPPCRLVQVSGSLFMWVRGSGFVWILFVAWCFLWAAFCMKSAIQINESWGSCCPGLFWPQGHKCRFATQTSMSMQLFIVSTDQKQCSLADMEATLPLVSSRSCWAKDLRRLGISLSCQSWNILNESSFGPVLESHCGWCDHHVS